MDDGTIPAIDDGTITAIDDGTITAIDDAMVHAVPGGEATRAAAENDKTADGGIGHLRQATDNGVCKNAQTTTALVDTDDAVSVIR